MNRYGYVVGIITSYMYFKTSYGTKVKKHSIATPSFIVMDMLKRKNVVDKYK